jgi:hypothetical protein
MEKNGKKIYEHSADLETSRQVLDQLGLRKTLIKIKNNLNEEGSLAWVINRQPLETKPLGHGMGKTAKELGITVVSHETGSFLAYESIVRSNVGKPNVFISRPNTPGEVAVYGPRFYTAKGDQGARRTGITIRFTVDPNARDGWDFDLTEIRYERDGKIADGTHVNFQNRAALTVIPESINMTPSGYFRFLAENKSISADDKAILWKFKCKLDNSFISGQISSNELQAIREVVLEQLKKNTLGPNVVLEEWIRLEGKLLKKDSKDIERLIQTLRSKTYEADPGTFFIMMTEIAKNTSLEHYVTQEWLPTLISFETSQPDIGDRAIHNSLFSNHLVLRKIGAKALLARKTMTPYVRALRGVFGQNGDAIAWLKLEANTFEEIEERAAYLALHPELKGALTSELKKSVEPILNDISNIKIYENLAGGHLSPSASPESFKFVSFDFPVGGKLLQLGGNESPHEVILAKSFQIQATPVTQRQWQLVMNNNPSYFQATDELNLDRPVESISWQETQQFIEKLNKLDDKYIYRLPTEAEWEYAAGRDRKYELVRYDAYLWHSGNSDEQTHRVASLKPNEYEIYDVYGNVRQWLQDWFDFYPGGQPVDPSGPAFGSTRVYRGTDWSSSAIFSPAKRGWGAFPSMRSNAYGFRLVRTKK